MKASRLVLSTALMLSLVAPAVWAADPPKKDAKPAPKPTAAAPAPGAKPAAPNPANAVPTTEPLNRDGDRHKLINSRAIPGQVDVIFLGDSITQGWEGAGKEAWEKYFGKLKPMNAGIGGDRTQHVLWRLENGNIKGITPKAAVLMIGTNNSGTNTSKEIADGVKAIVAKLRKELPQTKILLLAIFPRGADKNDERRKVNEGANKLIAEAADGKMVTFLDIGPKFLEADGTLSKEIMPDLLHLSPKGYEIWASSIIGPLTQLLGDAPAPAAPAKAAVTEPKSAPAPTTAAAPKPAPAPAAAPKTAPTPAPAAVGSTEKPADPTETAESATSNVVGEAAPTYNGTSTRRSSRPGLLRRIFPR